MDIKSIVSRFIEVILLKSNSSSSTENVDQVDK